MASEQQINRLPGLLATKMISQQISLTNRIALQSMTPTNTWRQDELTPNTADFRVGHLQGDWAFIRTSLFLTVNRCLTTE